MHPRLLRGATEYSFRLLASLLSSSCFWARTTALLGRRGAQGALLLPASTAARADLDTTACIVAGLAWLDVGE